MEGSGEGASGSPRDAEQVIDRATRLADHIAHKLANIILGIEDAAHSLDEHSRLETRALGRDLHELAARTTRYLKALRAAELHLRRFHLDDALRAWAMRVQGEFPTFELDWDCSGVLGGVEWSESQARDVIRVLDALVRKLRGESSARMMLTTTDVPQGPSRVVIVADGEHALEAAQHALRELPEACPQLRATMLPALSGHDSARFSLEAVGQ